MSRFRPEKLAKVELHVHLDTCLSYYCVRQLQPDMRLESFLSTFVAPQRCLDLGDFLSKIGPMLDILQTRTAITAAVNDLFDQLKADNVIYAELRFAPLLHTRLGLSSSDVVEIVLEEMDKASKEYGIEAGLLLCTLRHFSVEESMETAQLVTRYMEKGVIGLDLAADEARYSLQNHIAAFKHVHDMGGNTIAHAGEAKGAESVLEVLDSLNVSRIGHGVRSIEDPIAIERLKQEDVLLEICPSCNIVCNIFETLDVHPVEQLKQAGVKISINTDARTVVNTCLNREYQRLHDMFGWQYEDFVRCNIDALNASFITSQLRNELINKVNKISG